MYPGDDSYVLIEASRPQGGASWHCIISFILYPVTPAFKAALAGHVPANNKIRYKLFYWSRHFCNRSTVDPVFFSSRVFWISEGPVLPSHQPQQVYAWDAKITAHVGYVVSSLGALLLCCRGLLRHHCAAFHLGKRYNVSIG